MVAAVLIASAEGIAALGNGAYDSIATGELWTLITGRHTPLGFGTRTAWPDAIGAMLLAWPAWTTIAAAGSMLLLACRPRRRRAEYREASMRFSSSLH